ncbi:MAG TPA: hypothetical protein VM012_02580 [Flavitalea sp.]|nr:hypothetical protein [Flavitalea sp.]
MNTIDLKQAARVRMEIALYNMVPNLFWSLLCITPAAIYCFNEMPEKYLYVSAAISLITIFLPNRFLNQMQIGRTVKFYEKMGVPFINKFSQHGSYINRVIKRKFPDYTVVSKQHRSVNKLLQQSYMFEKFHFMLFIFYLSLFIYAFIQAQYLWAIIIFVANVIYNVYPCFLQQYLRVRLKLFRK